MLHSIHVATKCIRNQVGKHLHHVLLIIASNCPLRTKIEPSTTLTRLSLQMISRWKSNKQIFFKVPHFTQQTELFVLNTDLHTAKNVSSNYNYNNNMLLRSQLETFWSHHGYMPDISAIRISSNDHYIKQWQGLHTSSRVRIREQIYMK